MFCFSDWTHFQHRICLAFWQKKSFPHSFINTAYLPLFFRGAFALYAHRVFFTMCYVTFHPSVFLNQGTPSTEPSTTQEIGSHSGPHMAWHFDSLNLPLQLAQTSQRHEAFDHGDFKRPKRIQGHLSTIDVVYHKHIHLVLTLLLNCWWVRPGFIFGLMPLPSVPHPFAIPEKSCISPLCHHRSITPNQRTLFSKNSYTMYIQSKKLSEQEVIMLTTII